jgi:hypothetical protein
MNAINLNNLTSAKGHFVSVSIKTIKKPAESISLASK